MEPRRIAVVMLLPRPTVIQMRATKILHGEFSVNTEHISAGVEELWRQDQGRSSLRLKQLAQDDVRVVSNFLSCAR